MAKAEKAASKPAIAEEGAEIEKVSKKKPPVALVAAAIALSGGAGAGVYFLAPASLFGAAAPAVAHDQPAAEGGHGPEADARKEEKKEVKKDGAHAKAEKSNKKDSHGAGKEGDAAAGPFRIVGDLGVYAPEPLVVSVRPQGHVRYLKLGYAVETTPESADIFIERELRIADTLNAYLRAVEVSALEDPASLSRIRAQIGRRIALVVEPAPVNAILITDFILS